MRSSASLRLSLVSSILLVFLTGPVHAQPLPRVPPEQAGISTARLQRIDTVMEQFIAGTRISGMVTAVARDGKLIQYESYGMLDRERETPMSENALFRIASMSKPVTAVAALILFEEGRFLLDDPVSDFIPEFRDMKVLVESDGAYSTVPAEGEILIRHLFMHTAGFTYGSGELGRRYAEAGITSGLAPTPGTIGDMVRKLADQPILFNPGERWEYGLSSDVLGYLVEVVSGIPLDVFMRERIFEPLEMHDTGFSVPAEKRHLLATDYRRTPDGALEPVSADTLPGPDTDYFSGGAGLISSAGDYLRFAQMLLNGGELDGVRILSPKTIQRMTALTEDAYFIWGGRDGVRSTHGDRYALSVGVRTEPIDLGSLGTYGWGGAFHTLFWVDPVENMVAVFMSQLVGADIRRHHRIFKILTYQSVIDSYAEK